MAYTFGRVISGLGRTAGLLAASLVLCTAAGVPLSQAAEVEFRPDLVEHIRALKRVYPAEGPSSVLGELKGADPEGTPESQITQGDFSVIRLSGVIEAGDAEKLKAAFEKSPTWGKVVVFESPGGSFLEGFKIAEAVRYDLESQDPGMQGVFVLGGSECLSACAIAFALSVDLVHPDQKDTRFIEDGARVGFHMGFLPKDKASQTAEVGQILNLSYDISAAYSRLLNGGANPPSLFREALKHRSEDSFYYLVGNVKAWEMGFTPVSSGLPAHPAYAYGLDEMGAARICNTLIVHGRAYKAGAEMEFGMVNQPETPKPMESSEGQTAWYSVGTSSSFACSLRIGADKRLYASAWRGKRQCADGFQDADGFDDDFCPGRPVFVAPVTAGMIGDAFGCPGGQLDTTGYWYDEKGQSKVQPGRVTREVNFRDNPDLKGAVLGKLQPGQAVTIRSCRMLPDFQAVWYEVDTGSQQGWVSARFVQPGLFQFSDKDSPAE
ncbi:MAG: SH3 domain-containing protein [Notoacmeibacter sp.]|nr:SH3 domain-containing protein [Notoacmeibacter sp.]